MSAEIPVVSFAPFLSGSEEQRHEVAQQVYNAMSTVGFIYLKDHGISDESVQQIFNESKRFFSLPKSTKLNYALTDAALNQGYTADGAEGLNDHKECYEHRRYNNPLCPTDSVLPHFSINVSTFHTQCSHLALEVLRCLAIIMKLPSSYFDAITVRADPQLRLLHYPSITRRELEMPGHSRISAHTDFGFCTLLFQDEIGGLEIDPFQNGTFTSAPPIKGTVLVNIGDLATRLTNGRMKSTLHRVVSPRSSLKGGARMGTETAQRRDSGVAGVNGNGNVNENGETGTETVVDPLDEVLPARYSIPFFVHPDPETLIDPLVLEEGEVKKFRPVIAKEWRDYNTRRNYGLDGREKTSLSRGDGDWEVS